VACGFFCVAVMAWRTDEHIRYDRVPKDDTLGGNAFFKQCG
jgi:hypothetical protein